MSRLKEAAAELERFRRERAQRTPDLFTDAEPSWEQPASVTEEWKAAALELVRNAALTRATFTVENLDWPTAYDARARGAALRTAARKGWITNDGYVTGGTKRHGRPIVRWRSRIHATSGRPPAPAVNDSAERAANVRTSK